MLQEIIFNQPKMAQQGLRRLLVLSGSQGWQQAILQSLSHALPGDWLYITEKKRQTESQLQTAASASLLQYDSLVHNPPVFHHTPSFNPISLSAIRTLLGQEFTHGVFDATEQLDVEALAIIAGTLAAGSWLVLLAPNWQQWPQRIDRDAIRWSDHNSAIPTPHFIAYLQQQIMSDSEVQLWSEAAPAHFTPLAARLLWSLPDGQPTTEQQQILQQLLKADKGLWMLTAARGRGKSALAGMLAKAWSGKGACWLTAPAKENSTVLQHYAQGSVHFFSPDELSSLCHQCLTTGVDWLLVDEAAVIPLAQLYQWLKCFPRVLLISTVQGYEGTGRGLLLKLCAQLPVKRLGLLTPIRWAATDPLQRFINNLLLLEEPHPLVLQQPLAKKAWQLLSYSQQELVAAPDKLKAFYLLLTSAHYRTRPLDLRRLMDAPGMDYGLVETDLAAWELTEQDPVGKGNQKKVIGAVWRVNEGGIDLWLAREIWAGRRRPRGSLVAQSIAAHGEQWQAPVLRSSRISRIAVEPLFRRQGIARALISQQLERAQRAGNDYLSVSFGFTVSLWHFWHACGFQLLRIGTHREASSGCYAVMALIPISSAGIQLAASAQQAWRRNASILPQEVVTALDSSPPVFEQDFDYSDWQEAAGFAFAHRSLKSSYAALLRLLYRLSAEDAPLSTLRLYLEQNRPLQECVEREAVSGKKELLAHWRQGVAQALLKWDQAYSQQWKQWVKGEVMPLPLPAKR